MTLVANGFHAHCDDCGAMERLTSMDSSIALAALKKKGWGWVKLQIGRTGYVRKDILLCSACHPDTKQPE